MVLDASLEISELAVNAVDLFCGAGGLTHGLESVGINVLVGVDIDPTCEYPYTGNNRSRFLLKSVEDLRPEELRQIFPKDGMRVLVGCAPCQTFSTYNQKARNDDTRWWLLRHFSRLATEVLPDIISMENVPNLMRQDVFQEFIAALRDSGYHVSHQVVQCEAYGVPQHRQRLVLLASRQGPIRLIGPSEFGEHSRRVEDSIRNLPSLEAGEVDVMDPLHQTATLSALNGQRIRASKPGGTWRDWQDSLVADCHRRGTGKTYPSVYGRMRWDEPAPTITTQFFGFGNGRFGHPEQDRAISLREGAILQGFPRDYKFVPPGKPIHRSTVGRLIGNAVPPTIGRVIGRSILEHIRNSHIEQQNVCTGEM